MLWKIKTALEKEGKKRQCTQIRRKDFSVNRYGIALLQQ